MHVTSGYIKFSNFPPLQLCYNITGARLFAILDLVWPAGALITVVAWFAVDVKTAATYTYAGATMSAVFAGLLLYGLSSKRWRFLLGYVIWQV